MKNYIFPAAMILLDLGQAIMSIATHEPIKAIYWVSAAVLNATVMIM